MKLLKKLAAILMIFSAFTIGGFACGGGAEEENGQDVGQTMEDTGEQMGESAEEGVDRTGEAIEDTGDSMQ